jgi:chromosome segregation ATPase
MADQRALDAINRIERALARIEAGARNAAPAEKLQQVRAAHQALRSRVEGAIGQIDHLLETEAR